MFSRCLGVLLIQFRSDIVAIVDRIFRPTVGNRFRLFLRRLGVRIAPQDEHLLLGQLISQRFDIHEVPALGYDQKRNHQNRARNQQHARRPAQQSANAYPSSVGHPQLTGQFIGRPHRFDGLGGGGEIVHARLVKMGG